MLTVKIPGSVCISCISVEIVAHMAISDQATEAKVIEVTDLQNIVAYNTTKPSCGLK